LRPRRAIKIDYCFDQNNCLVSLIPDNKFILNPKKRVKRDVLETWSSRHFVFLPFKPRPAPGLSLPSLVTLPPTFIQQRLESDGR
jgi:hypothetical protein